jgi:hypothetical protein
MEVYKTTTVDILSINDILEHVPKEFTRNISILNFDNLSGYILYKTNDLFFIGRLLKNCTIQFILRFKTLEEAENRLKTLK